MTKRAEKRQRMREKIISQLKEQKPSSSATSSENASNTASSETLHSSHHHNEQNRIKNPFLRFYDKNMVRLEIIPVILIILAIVQIGFQMSANNGDFMNKDISLKGGISLTIALQQQVDTAEISKYLLSRGFTANVRSIESGGRQIALAIDSDIDFNDKEKIDSFMQAVKEKVPLEQDQYSLEGIGSSIGSSFFKQTILALIFSFIIMSLVIIITFRSFIPCITMIGCVISDIIVTLAIVNLLGIKVSTAGVAAFLMLIGYSVDSDILLTTRVLKRKEGSFIERTVSAFKTGMIMALTTIAVLVIGLFVSTSEVIRQIMTILLIGLLVDQIMTWIQNTSILRLYVENKEKKQALKISSKQG